VKASVASAKASPEASPEALAAELLKLWHHLIKGSTPQMYALLSELDLSMTQMKTLHTLAAAEDELALRDLAGCVAMSLPNASRTIDGLVHRGFVERREDEEDRRIKRVRITGLGREVVDRIDTARLQGLAEWSASLTPEQRTRLLDALSHLPEEHRS
jgi:DNA-binding MarR family transcriptional regulator